MTPPGIYGLIGYPVKHSLSAVMHNAAFAALKINAEYRLFEMEPAKLEAFLLDNIKVSDTKGKEFYSKDIIGFNITIPYKVRAYEILKKKLPLSFGKLAQVDQYYVKLSGAVNTVKRENNQPLYWNTDAWGFLKSLESKEKGDWGLGFSPTGKSALIIGSGGAGQAVIAALSWKKSGMKKIYVYEKDNGAVVSAQKHFFNGNLSREWVDSLRQKLEFISVEKIAEATRSCDLLVNASPVGMENDGDSVISRHMLEKNKNLSVYDVVYNRTTQLVKDAKSLGLPVVGGKGMFLYQGKEAFELWFPERAKEDAEIEKAMRKALSEEASG